MYAVECPFSKGDSVPLGNLLNSGNLEPGPLAMVRTFLDADPGQSEKGIMRQAKLNQEYERLNNEQARILISISNADRVDDRAMQNIALKVKSR